jgi:cellulose synthase/poly-beta-1,6-N-acetylglucosamine synthase-like glycosyltransferase
MEILFWVSVSIVFYTYIGYGILLWCLVRIKELFIPYKETVLPQELPSVTLLIAAYNEEDYVEAKMQNCRELDYPADKITILWITDGSDDRTNELLQQYPDAKIYYQPERRGKTAALNRAIDFVQDSLVLFSDANSMLNKDALKEIVLKFSNPKVGCVSGEKRVEAQDDDAVSSKGEGAYWKYESTLKELDSRLYSVVGAAGELFALRTELYQQLPDDTLLDDFMLSMLITMKGYKNAYCPKAYAVEGGSLDMKEEGKRKVRIAAGGLQSVWRLRSLLNIFRYGILSFQYVSHRVLRWTITPFLLFALLFITFFLYLQGNLFLYGLILVAQFIFYFLAILGNIYGKKYKFLYIPYYFVFMNINVFKGIIYLIKKKK